ncbi:MAG: methyltransferase domain-containing protein [Nitrospiria bacterium]
MALYKQSFYSERDASTRYTANTVLARVVDFFPEIESAVDIGCGVGTWLSVLKSRGVRTIQGVDGPWVDRRFLVIPDESFATKNLATGPLDLGRRYDLAICVEVAEHVPQERAQAFIEGLTRLSDLVLFSAAIPGQGGTGHINEQWPEYWANLFSAHGYVCADGLRFALWHDQKIPWWYRQNILLFAAARWEPRLRVSGLDVVAQPLPVVHPAHFKRKTTYSTRKAFLLTLTCFGRAIRHRLAAFTGLIRESRA